MGFSLTAFSLYDVVDIAKQKLHILRHMKLAFEVSELQSGDRVFRFADNDYEEIFAERVGVIVSVEDWPICANGERPCDVILVTIRCREGYERKMFFKSKYCYYWPFKKKMKPPASLWWWFSKFIEVTLLWKIYEVSFWMLRKAAINSQLQVKANCIVRNDSR